MSLYDELCEKKVTYMPIDTICGINATMRFRYIHNIFEVIIESEWEECVLYYKDLKNQEELDLVLNNVSSLKFSKMDSYLYVNETELQSNRYKKILNSMGECPNIKLSIQECSVCLEMTNKKTRCKHPLCYVCYSSLVSKDCPLCRKSLNHYCNHDEDDEEADE